MRSLGSDSTHLPHPNAFDAAFLRRLGEEDHPPNTEAEVCGPWQVDAAADGWTCSTPGGAEPEVEANERDVALLAAAALPASGRPARFRLADSPAPPFPLLDYGQPAGSLARYRQELVTAMNVLDAVVHSPLSLVHLFEAAGAEVLERAGRIFAARHAEPREAEPREGGEK